MQTYTGSCHCGAVSFTVEADIQKVIECDCSHCYRKGFLLAFIPASQFSLESGADNLTEYRFNKKFIAHVFCKTCGVQCFGRATNENGTDTIAINVRTLSNFDNSALIIEKYAGKDI